MSRLTTWNRDAHFSPAFCSTLFRRYGPRVSIRRDGGRADQDVPRRARNIRRIHDACDVHYARRRPNKTDGIQRHRSDNDELSRGRCNESRLEYPDPVEPHPEARSISPTHHSPCELARRLLSAPAVIG